MLKVAADMHIHTALSPCAARAMTPPAIAREAARKGMAMIAVCDHNSAGNVDAVAAAAAALPDGPVVIPGIEITTAEEVHVLGFFPDGAAARAAAAEVVLPPWRPLAPRTSKAGMRQPDQALMDAEGRITGIEERMLAAASAFTLSETVDLIHRHGGLAVAAHMDRRSFSVTGQLGFLPPDVPFDGLEVSAAGVAQGRAAEFAGHGLPLLSSSDGHFLEDIGAGFTVLDVEEPGFAELARALHGVGGRGCTVA
jgi:3',5'-nucleoside bisphosphate phosphatase